MRKWRGIVVSVAVVAALLGTSRVSAAATFTYPSGACPAGGSGLSDCVDVAAAGDVIKVKPGTYYENVTVDEDVTIKAKDCDNPPLLDAAADGAGNPDDSKSVGFDVTADGVTIDCIRIRHATDGISVGSGTGFDNVSIKRISTINAETSVDADAGSDNLIVKDSLFRHGNNEAIDFNGGTGLQITGNRCENLGSDCMDVSDAPAAQILNNAARLIDDGGLIEVFGDSDQIVIDGNKLSNADGEAIAVFCCQSSGVIVRNNVVTNNGETAFEVTSPDLQVTNNRAIGNFEDDPFDLDCHNPCANGLIQGNVFKGTTPDDDDGYSIDAPDYGPLKCPSPPCLRILDNTSGNAAEEGFEIRGNFIEIRGNTTSGNGESDSNQGYGFYFDGSTSTVVENASSDNAVDGFRISGDNNTIQDNVSKANAVDGFDVVSGDGNLLDGNTSKKNNGDGIDNHADNTDLTNNLSSGNRVDCTNSGTIDVNTGNTCADESDFAGPSSIE